MDDGFDHIRSQLNIEGNAPPRPKSPPQPLKGDLTPIAARSPIASPRLSPQLSPRSPHTSPIASPRPQHSLQSSQSAKPLPAIPVSPSEAISLKIAVSSLFIYFLISQDQTF